MITSSSETTRTILAIKVSPGNDTVSLPSTAGLKRRLIAMPGTIAGGEPLIAILSCVICLAMASINPSRVCAQGPQQLGDRRRAGHLAKKGEQLAPLRQLALGDPNRQRARRDIACGKQTVSRRHHVMAGNLVLAIAQHRRIHRHDPDPAHGAIWVLVPDELTT